MTKFVLKISILAVPMLLVIAAPKNTQNKSVLTPILGNYPDTLLPLSTDSTVTPDAPPANTTSIDVSTSTDFNGTLEASPVTGVVRITDAHPAGTYTVTVRAFDSGGASATKAFTLSVTTPATCNNPVSFVPPANFATGAGSNWVVVGDFNGDGNQDLAVANYTSNNVSILLGDGAGHFSAATSFGAGTNPDSVAVGDFNGDGKQDLAVANYSSDNVSILLGDGAGHFSAATNFGAGSSPASVAVGDFNRDGNQDLAVANVNSYNVSILLGDGTGHFNGPTNFPVGFFPYSVAVGDFNGDGNQDLAVANYASNNVSILLGDGAGHFSTATNFGVGSYPYPVAVGDFNNDGKQDLAVASYGYVSILLRDCFLTPSSAVSRKTHGSVGTFDINLPLIGNPGIECRSTGGTRDYTMVITYPDNVTVEGNPQGGVTTGTGCVGSGGVCTGNVTVNENVVTIPLTNIDNDQEIDVTLFGVNNSDHTTIPMIVVAGDVNSNQLVNAADVAQTKSRLGQTVDATNFRSDLNTNGAISAGDISIVKRYLGTGWPPPP